MLRRVARIALAAVAAGVIVPASAAGQGFVGELTNYVDERQQTALSFGDHSHWLQPWRAYIDTVPAAELRDAVGMVFNVPSQEAEATARLLGANGVRRARVEVPWNALRYDRPSIFAGSNGKGLRTTLEAFKRHGIRPLILLNSNHGAPCPLVKLTIRTVEPAIEGDNRIHLDSASAGAIAPGRTGLDGFQTSGKAADPLFTSIDAGGWATLSRPLRRDLAVGSYKASKLLYAPFRRPFRPDGSPDPGFEATLAGWLSYVNVVTREARAILGNHEFDVEVWNEQSFGEEFLDIDEYYHPNIDDGEGNTTEAILARTVAWLRDPSHGVAGVGIGNGFASQRYWDAGSTSPPGLTAIDKHPYLYWGMRRFPPGDGEESRPLDALGGVDGTADPLTGDWSELFTPAYADFHPERYLWATHKYRSSAIQLDNLVRDLSPHTTYVDGVAHGRDTHPEGAAPPGMWITEMNINPLVAPKSFGLKAGDRLHFQAKATLRTLTAFVNKGVSAVHMYAAKNGNYALVANSFFSAFAQTKTYPGDGAGGEVLESVRRLTEAMGPAEPIAQPRSLSLLHVGDYAGNKQFEGDGTAEHPPLYNRDVLAFLPFQVSDGRFVIAVYVMTANMAKVYDTAAPTTDPTRYDMPEETYRLTIGNTGGDGVTVSATDPLTGEVVPATVVAREADQLVVELPVTDSPRLLTVDETG